MLVETYEVENVANEPAEITQEAMKLCEDLGLTGQMSLVNAAQTQRCPFRHITKEENFAYRVLCPNEIKPEDYKSGPIPIRVLQIWAYAKTLTDDCGNSFFKRFLIWEKEGAVIEDPVLVGIREEKVNGQSWTSTVTYILARWGDELESLAVLLDMALAKRRKEVESKLTRSLTAFRNMSDSELIEEGTSYNVYA